MKKEKKPAETSWGKISEWYDEHLEKNDNTYQKKVILPNLLRVLGLRKTDWILDIACGQGFFTREFAKSGATVSGADISKELIGLAKKHSPIIDYRVSSADNLAFAKDGQYSVATIVLAIQNIQNMDIVFSEAARVLSPGGRLLLVMNHPAFRVPRGSGWSWDEKEKIQYRRVDKYLSSGKFKIVANPGKKESETTVSFHRSLQDFFKALAKSGFAVTRLEEWISHKKSGNGPRREAEDKARKEIPLFLMLEARKVRS